MLKVLTRIMQPTSGSIQVRGRLSALIEVSAGFHPDLTGRENVFLNGTILGLKRDEIRRRFDEIVAFSGLEAFIDTPVKRYSSGMFARLGFSVAAHVNPDVLLVDEVLSVGDYLFQQRCVERMTQIIEQGTSVVFISHNLRAISNLCHRSLLLQKGTVGMVGPTSDVLKKYLGAGEERIRDVDRDLQITKVIVSNEDGPAVEFKSGDRMWITIEARATRRHDDVSVVMQILDDARYPLFGHLHRSPGPRRADGRGRANGALHVRDRARFGGRNVSRRRLSVSLHDQSALRSLGDRSDVFRDGTHRCSRAGRSSTDVDSMRDFRLRRRERGAPIYATAGLSVPETWASRKGDLMFAQAPLVISCIETGIRICASNSCVGASNGQNSPSAFGCGE